MVFLSAAHFCPLSHVSVFFALGFMFEFVDLKIVSPCADFLTPNSEQTPNDQTGLRASVKLVFVLKR